MAQERKRALVTGGMGFIGSHLVKRLVDAGWQVTVVDSLIGGYYADRAGPGCHYMFTDFSNPAVLSAIEHGAFDVVFHMAAIPRVSYSVEHPLETHENNVTKTLQLMQACVGHVERFVFSSSSSVYGGATQLPTPEHCPRDPKSPYALQKSIIEDYLRMYSSLYGLESVCLRYFNVYGPGARGDSPYSTAISSWLTALMEGRPMRSDGDGTQSRDMCYVDNVVDANVLVASSTKQFAGRAYNIACGEQHKNYEILAQIMKRFPNAQVMTAPTRPGDVKHTLASIRAAQEEFDYEPRVKLRDGLERTIEWFMSRPEWPADLR